MFARPLTAVAPKNKNSKRPLTRNKSLHASVDNLTTVNHEQKRASSELSECHNSPERGATRLRDLDDDSNKEARSVLALAEKIQRKKEIEKKNREQQAKLDAVKKLHKEEKTCVDKLIEEIEILPALTGLEKMKENMESLVTKYSEAFNIQDMTFLNNFNEQHIPLILNGINCSVNGLNEVLEKRAYDQPNDIKIFEPINRLIGKINMWFRMHEKLEDDLADMARLKKELSVLIQILENLIESIDFAESCRRELPKSLY